MSRKKLTGAILVIMSLLWLPLAGLNATKKQRVAMQEKRMLVLSEPSEGKIHLRVGEMLQLSPFSFPVTPKFLGASLKIELSGDRALELIGQSDVSANREGRSGRSAFLYVRAAGKTNVHVSLVDEDKKPLKGHSADYAISAED